MSTHKGFRGDCLQGQNQRELSQYSDCNNTNNEEPFKNTWPNVQGKPGLEEKQNQLHLSRGAEETQIRSQGCKLMV